MINIKNLRKEKPENPWDVVICRPSPLGNPFVGKNGVNEPDRHAVCDKYELWFHENIGSLEKYLDDLNTKHKKYGILNLFCWCSPKRCHCETVKKYFEENMEEDER